MSAEVLPLKMWLLKINGNFQEKKRTCNVNSYDLYSYVFWFDQCSSIYIKVLKKLKSFPTSHNNPQIRDEADIMIDVNITQSKAFATSLKWYFNTLPTKFFLFSFIWKNSFTRESFFFWKTYKQSGET